MLKHLAVCLVCILMLTGCAAKSSVTEAETGWKGRGTNSIPSVLANEESYFYFKNEGAHTYLMKERNGIAEKLCTVKNCEHGAWDCPAAAWNETVGLMAYGDALYARSLGAGAVVRYDLMGRQGREELILQEDGVEAFTIGNDVLYAVLQPTDGGFEVLALPLDEKDAQTESIKFAEDAPLLLSTDSALWYEDKLFVLQTVSEEGGAVMRIAQLDMEQGSVKVLAMSVTDRTISVTDGVLAYSEKREGSYVVCLRNLKDGSVVECMQSNEPVDVIATGSGFALDDCKSSRVVNWVDTEGKTLGSAMLNDLTEACSGALDDELYYVTSGDLQIITISTLEESA